MNRLKTYFGTQHRQKLVIIGTGWGGTAVHKYINKKLYDVKVVSPRNYFLFTPLLASTTTGTLNFTSIIDPVRQGHKFRSTQDYQCAKVLSIDPVSKSLQVQSALDESLKYDIEFDKLVIGCGAVTNTFNVPGVEEHAYFLKDISHAKAIQRQLAINLEIAAGEQISEAEKRQRLHVIIVGGGPTGIEFGAEVYDFMRADIKKKFPDVAKYVKVTIVDANRILGMFDAGLQKKASKKIEKRAGFQLYENTGVTEVQADRVVLSDDTVLRSNMVVWNTGLKPSPLFDEIGEIEKTANGYIKTDLQFETNYEDIFAIGDCGNVAEENFLQTAQQAEQQGRYLAKQVLNRPRTSKEDRKAYSYQHRGVMAYIGGYRAVIQGPEKAGSLDISRLSPKWEGVHGLVAWRSAYWTMLGRWHLRLQVPVDWMRSFLFGRDSSIFINDKRPKSPKSSSKEPSTESDSRQK